MKKLKIPGGVWSATPTPLTSDYRLDKASVHRMVAHQLKMGVSGLMVAGTCGEGPWLGVRDREALVRTSVAAAAGRLCIAVQVTDNSVARTLEQIEQAAAWGGQIAVVAQPYYLLNATPDLLLAFYQEIARRSPLPVGFYDRGKGSPYMMPDAHILEMLCEPNIVMAKDSAHLPEHRALFVQARQRRPELVLLEGWEFDSIPALEAGYDGVLFGGAIFNAGLAHRLILAVRAGDQKEAQRLQARMNDLMLRVYGGATIECWLTGLKELLVRMEIFSTNKNLLEYPLTETCLREINAAVSGADGLGYRSDLFEPAPT